MSDSLKVALGTTSDYKANAVKSVFYKLDIRAKVILVDVDSGVSDQPEKEGETLKGAQNRAQAALEISTNADIGLGVEFGYEPEAETNKMICYAVIAEKDGRILVEHSTSLQLPTLLQQKLESGENISDFVEEIMEKVEKRQQRLALANFLYKRKFIYEAVEAVMLKYILRGIIYN